MVREPPDLVMNGAGRSQGAPIARKSITEHRRGRGPGPLHTFGSICRTRGRERGRGGHVGGKAVAVAQQPGELVMNLMRWLEAVGGGWRQSGVMATGFACMHDPYEQDTIHTFRTACMLGFLMFHSRPRSISLPYRSSIRRRYRATWNHGGCGSEKALAGISMVKKRSEHPPSEHFSRMDSPVLCAPHTLSQT